MPADTPPAPDSPTANAPPPRQFRVPLYLVLSLLAVAFLAYDYRSALQFARTRRYIEQQCAIGTKWSEVEKSMRTAGVPTRRFSTGMAVMVGWKTTPASLIVLEKICPHVGSDAYNILGTWWGKNTRYIYLIDTTGTIVGRDR